MNRLGTIAVLAGGLAMASARSHAGQTVASTAAGPYSLISARNVFGLNPPQASSEQQQNSPPAPKITLTGITTILGAPEALYTVAGGPKDGTQRQDESYILKEGQEQDQVAVVSIDVEKVVVTFNNHGIRQEIALANGPTISEKLFAAPVVTNRLTDRNPKPGDYNYVDRQLVTTPLPPNVNPASAVEAKSLTEGGDAASDDTPSGHGGF